MNTIINSDESGPLTAIDSEGRRIVKGGQRIDGCLADSVIRCYTNLTNSPMALVLMVVLVLALVAEHHEKEGPFDKIVVHIGQVGNDTAEPAFVRMLAKGAEKFVRFVLDHERKVIAIGLIGVSVLAKPSWKNVGFGGMLAFFFLVTNKLTLIEILMFTQLLFLFVCLRNPAHKMMVVALAIAVFVLTIEFGI